MVPMSASDNEPSSCLSAALEAAGDVAYSWDLDRDRLEWSGCLPAAGIECATELATGRRFAGRIHPDDLMHRQLMLASHFDKSRLREAIDQIIAANQRVPSPAALLSIGVDNMTMINDLFGYQAADTVLIEIGRRLDACLRVSDLIGRLGGDRFGIVLSHCPPDN